jgi:AcrR family transcriptional regulator
MPSISSSPIRVAPQQDRSARRLAGFLQAAAELFAAVGYDATTMQAIADRSNSSIGALYNYFPDKESVAATLRQQYAEELQTRLKSVAVESNNLSAVRFAESFIGCITDFVQDRPAWLNLPAAPVSFRRDQAARKALRSTIADAFRTKNPFLSPERALLAANVAVQIVKGMTALCRESEAKSRDLVAAEFRKVLTSYLQGVLSEGQARVRHPKT